MSDCKGPQLPSLPTDALPGRVATALGLDSETVQTCKMIKVQTLLQCQESVSSAVPAKGESSTTDFTGNGLDGYSELRRSTLVLCGRLTSAPRRVPRNKWFGLLYLEDETGTIPCEVSSLASKFAVVGCWVACTRWYYGWEGDSENGFLEVDELHIMEGQIAGDVRHSVLRVVSVSSADVLLKNKDKLKRKTVDIIGTVKGLSEIIRIKGEPLFIVQLEEDPGVTINILVKKVSCLHWQKLLEPEREYILSGLRPTTLFKGTKQEHRIFVPWDNCRIYRTDLASYRILTLQDWLEENRENLLIPSGHSTTAEAETKQQKLFSYQGIVTSNTEAEKGIYELDGKIRLYTSYVPAMHKFYYLRPGTRVVVYNAHHTGAPKPPKIRLCCCLYGCIKVTTFSPLDSSIKLFKHYDCMLIHLLNMLNLNLAQFDWFIRIQSQLMERLAPRYMKDTAVGRLVFKLFTHQGVGPACWSLPVSVRHMLQEFLDQHHGSCNIVPPKTLFKAKCTFPSMADIKEHGWTEAQDFSESVRHLLVNPVNAQALNDSLYWNYKILDHKDFSMPWVVVGVLQLDGQTGHVELVDKTGSVNCVVAARDSVTSDAAPPSTCDTCDRSQTSCHCGHIGPSHIGALVRVDHFAVVVERFVVSNFPSVEEVGDVRFIKKLHVNIYLQFSMKDVVLLYKKDQYPPETVSSDEYEINGGRCHVVRCEKPDRKRGRDGTESESRSVKRQAVNGPKGLRRTDPLHVEQIHTTNDVIGVGQRPTYTSQLFVVTHKDSLQVESRIDNSAKLRFYVSACLVGETGDHRLGEPIQTAVDKPKDSDGPGVPGNQSKLPVKHVVLAFQNTTVRWYHLLRVGRVYRIVQKDSLWSGSGVGLPPTLHRVIERAHVRQCLPVNNEAVIHAVNDHEESNQTPFSKLTAAESTLCQEVIDCLKSTGHLCPVLSIQQVLDSSKLDLMCLTGLVLSRQFTDLTDQRPAAVRVLEEEENETLRVSVPQGRHICLVLCDPDTAGRLKVYIKPHNISYPLGLLGGATVELHKVQLRRSQKDFVYGQYLVASSCCVRVLAEGSTSLKARHMSVNEDRLPTDLTSVPRYNLTDLWGRHGTEGRLFTVVCHVHKVLWLSIWSNCTDCGHLHKQGACTHVSCRSRSSPRVKVKASIIVDDGTSNAFLLCNGDRLVQALLDLSATQWKMLELTAQEQGELQYKQSGGDERPGMELFLQHLCDSPSVKRHVIVYAKLTKAPPSTKGCLPRSVDVGGGARVETRSLPFLQLSCIHLEPVSHSNHINTLL